MFSLKCYYFLKVLFPIMMFSVYSCCQKLIFLFHSVLFVIIYVIPFKKRCLDFSTVVLSSGCCLPDLPLQAVVVSSTSNVVVVVPYHQVSLAAPVSSLSYWLSYLLAAERETWPPPSQASPSTTVRYCNSGFTTLHTLKL